MTRIYAFRLISVRAALPRMDADEIRAWRKHFAGGGQKLSGIEWGEEGLRTVIVWEKGLDMPGDHELWHAYLAALAAAQPQGSA